MSSARNESPCSRHPRPSRVGYRNGWRKHVGERIRETFLHGLRPDIVHVASLFEGLVDDAVTSVGTIRTSHATATTFYDLIPLTSGESLPTAASVAGTSESSPR